MAQDNTIPRTEPGVAGFSTESYGNSPEPRFGEGVADTVDVPVTNTGSTTLALPLYSVVKYDRQAATLVLAQFASGVSDANALTAQPISIAPGASARVAVYTAGHWSMDALNFHASFDTNEKKAAAFEAKRPGMLVSKKKFTDAAIDIPN